MISQSNIPFATVRRLKNDETGEITFICTRDGVPYDITGERFSVGICDKGTLNERIRLDHADLIRPAGTVDRFIVDFPAAERAKLTEAEYTGYVYLIRPDGRRDPRAWFAYELLTQPSNFVPGQPIEPAYLQLDYNTQIAEYILLPVYILTTPAFSSIAAAHAAPLPTNTPLFITINQLPYLKTAAGVCLLPINPPETTD